MRFSNLDNERNNLLNFVNEIQFTEYDTFTELSTSTFSDLTEGQILRIKDTGFAYEVAATDATDHHLTTAGGVKLYVLQHQDGYHVDAFGAVGDGVTDDTAAIQAASDAAEELLKGLERSKIIFRSGAQYLISSGLVFNGHSVEGNGAGILCSTAGITMVHIGKGVSANNQVFKDLFVRFSSLQSNPASICIALAEDAANLQASKNTFINVQTRFGYHGFYSLGGSAANGSIFGSNFINCRALKSYDWAWYLNCSLGTTTMTLSGCAAEGDPSSPQAKGFYLDGSTEWVLSNCSADKCPDGNALDLRNARAAWINTFAIESCNITTSNNRLVNLAGSGFVNIGNIAVKQPEIDVGGGNKGYYVYISSGTLVKIENIEVTGEILTSGSSVKLRQTDDTILKTGYFGLDDTEVQNNVFSSTWTGEVLRGFATNTAGLPSAGNTRRMIFNRLPTFGEAAFWVDNGTEFLAVGPLLSNQTSVNIGSITSPINTTGKFSGKPIYNSTASEVFFATGSAAGDSWLAYDGSSTITPV